MSVKWKLRLVYLATSLVSFIVAIAIFLIGQYLALKIMVNDLMLVISGVLGVLFLMIVVVSVPLYISLIVAKKLGWNKEQAKEYFCTQAERACSNTWVLVSLSDYGAKKFINKIYNQRLKEKS